MRKFRLPKSIQLCVVVVVVVGCVIWVVVIQKDESLQDVMSQVFTFGSIYRSVNPDQFISSYRCEGSLYVPPRLCYIV